LVLARVRLLLKRLRISRLEGTGTVMTCTFAEPVSWGLILETLCDAKCFATLHGERKMTVELEARTTLAALVRLKRLLQGLADHVRDLSQFNRLVSPRPSLPQTWGMGSREGAP